MSSDMDKAGILSLIRLSPTERDLFLDYIHNSKDTSNYDVLYSILGDQLLKFIDIFSGETLKVPTRDEIVKVVKYIKIYHYCEARNFSEDSVEAAAKIFGRRKNSVKRIVDKVKRIKDGGSLDLNECDE